MHFLNIVQYWEFQKCLIIMKLIMKLLLSCLDVAPWKPVLCF